MLDGKNDKAIQSISIIREGNHKGLPLRINDDKFKNERSLLSSGHSIKIFVGWASGHHDLSFNQELSARLPTFRKYKLDFITVVLLILQNSIKPMQLVLNEFFKRLDNGIMVRNRASTQARRHLKATAFVTLKVKSNFSSVDISTTNYEIN
ncbi:MAG: hypothetical protein ABFS56_29295 [Pseudomonadota bacterium]